MLPPEMQECPRGTMEESFVAARQRAAYVRQDGRRGDDASVHALSMLSRRRATAAGSVAAAPMVYLLSEEARAGGSGVDAPGGGEGGGGSRFRGSPRQCPPCRGNVSKTAPSMSVNRTVHSLQAGKLRMTHLSPTYTPRASTGTRNY